MDVQTKINLIFAGMLLGAGFVLLIRHLKGSSKTISSQGIPVNETVIFQPTSHVSSISLTFAACSISNNRIKTASMHQRLDETYKLRFDGTDCEILGPKFYHQTDPLGNRKPCIIEEVYSSSQHSMPFLVGIRIIELKPNLTYTIKQHKIEVEEHRNGVQTLIDSIERFVHTRASGEYTTMPLQANMFRHQVEFPLSK